MVLLNASSKARNAARIITQNQGGGSKKAGLPYVIGRGSWSSIFMGPSGPNSYTRSVSCCKRIDLATTYTTANIGRPQGRMPGGAYHSITGQQL